MASESSVSVISKQLTFLFLDCLLLFLIGPDSLHQPIGKRLPVVAEDEPALVEGILDVPQLNEECYGG